jgi:hypothetical protein
MKDDNLEDISDRLSGKMVLLVMGSMIAFLVLLYITAVLENRALGYIVFSVFLILGLAMIFRYKVIGTAIYRANLTICSWVWRHVIRLSEEKVQKRKTEFKASFLGYNYHLGITFIVGLGLITVSIWSFIMLCLGQFYG